MSFLGSRRHLPIVSLRRADSPVHIPQHHGPGTVCIRGDVDAGDAAPWIRRAVVQVDWLFLSLVLLAVVGLLAVTMWEMYQQRRLPHVLKNLKPGEKPPWWLREG